MTSWILLFKIRNRNKNIDSRGKKSCAYEIDRISLFGDLTTSIALNFCVIYFIATQKKKITLEDKINSKKTNIYM